METKTKTESLILERAGLVSSRIKLERVAIKESAHMSHQQVVQLKKDIETILLKIKWLDRKMGI